MEIPLRPLRSELAEVRAESQADCRFEESGVIPTPPRGTISVRSLRKFSMLPGSLMRPKRSSGVLIALFVVVCLGHTCQAEENRLSNESSPYLRLHAHNPVDWYPWGPEALAKAKKENKVIFLSVGYSSCYWCHVMERESFMDAEIAKFLNDNFVCVKVDREERPDVDAIYMLAVQLVTGRGGWPMSVFLTPDTKPFFGGTYFPARDGDRGNSTGFLSLIRQIKETWEKQEKELRASSNQLTDLIRKNLDGSAGTSGAPLPAIDKALATSLGKLVQDALVREFDPQYGGFGFDPGSPSRPKFPEASNLLFLLQQARAGNEKALQMVDVTLQKMHAGGIWDHVGGGFHRYSVDRFWHIPHFEKMLYDNGQLAVAYTQAFELTQKQEYQRVVTRMLDWTIREMKDQGGAFYSALDAESEQVEGKFYRWELPEIKKLLGKSYELYATTYGLDAPPNFEHRFHVPQLEKTLAAIATERNSTEEVIWNQLRLSHQTLLEARNKRPRPLTDTKVLASWNGLMIRGLADAGRVFKRQDYTKAAADAANFILTKMRTADGRLYRTFTAGEAKLNAYLDDYAFLVDGLIALHKATGDQGWLQNAAQLTDMQIRFFHDTKNAGFFFTSNDHESLIARGKQPSDGAQPAGNSVTAQNLIYLAEKLNRTDYREIAESTVAATVPSMRKSPRLAPRMAVALLELFP